MANHSSWDALKYAKGRGDPKKLDRILSRIVKEAGNTVSGLDLSACGEDGHALANRLWKVAYYLKVRDTEEEEDTFTQK